MEKVKKVFNLRMLVAIVMLLSLSIYFTTAGGMNYYVNGKPVSSKQGQPFVKSGVTYVPLQATLKGMGGHYRYNPKYRTAIIKSKGSKQVITIKNGYSYAKIGKRSVALKTKKVKNKYVNANAKAMVIRNVFYVPVDFLKAQYKYPVTIKKDKRGTSVYVGKVPQPKKTTVVKPTPKPKPTASLNKEAVINSLASQKFYKHSATLATLNVDNLGGSGNVSVAVDLTKDSNMMILIRDWERPDNPNTKVIPSRVKSAIKYISPAGESALYGIVDEVVKRGSSRNLNKTFTYNGLKAKVVTVPGEIRVVYSK